MAGAYEEKSVFDPPLVWSEILELGIKDWSRKSLQATMCKLCWSGAVYYLWGK
jgi:hypothetical protein